MCTVKTDLTYSTKKIKVAFIPNVIVMFLFSIAAAQDIHPSAIIQIKKADPEMIKKLSLQSTSNHENEFMEEFKNFQRRLKKKSINDFSNTSTPIDIGISAQKKPPICPPLVQTNFDGNPQTPYYLLPLGYGPSECDIAISNAGKIVSISTGWIRYYNENGTLVFSDSLYHFGNSLNDCHVLYDPKADRFVFSSQYGYYNAEPFIFNTFGTLVGFSKSNDPMDGWNLYQFPFTDFHDNSAGDYPLLALSDNEVFITLNYYNAGDRYKHIEIIQINKGDGYAGSASLTSQKYDATLTGNTKGTMVPAQGGSTTYGPNIYFIMANESGNSSKNKYYVYEVTNTIASGQAVLKRYGLVTSNISYSAQGTSYQPGGIPVLNVFAADDVYMEDAFFENGVLQFCQHTNVNGKAAVCLGRITGIPGNLVCTAKTISDPNLYLSYPSIVYTGNSSADNSAIVGIEHSGANTYPGLSAVYINSNFDISPLTTVKAGADTINGLWGDYSGICRRYNDPGEVWFEGQYGSTTSQYINWIAKLQKPAVCQEQSIVSKTLQSEELNTSLQVFPNPFSNSTSISFSISNSEKVYIKIFDEAGRLVKILADSKFEKGKYELKWNTTGIGSGIYFLQFDAGIYSDTKKILVAK